MKKDISDRQFRSAEIIATFCGIGNIKYAPGTMGSIATFPVFIIINWIFMLLNLYSFWQLLVFYLVILAAGFYKGMWAIEVYMTKNKVHDPKEVVIDEVEGQLIALMMPTLFALHYFSCIVGFECFSKFDLVIISLILIVLPIALFRLFDIWKPSIIGYFDKKVKGAFGVMMDDIVAGIYAGLLTSLILSIFLVSTGCLYWVNIVKVY